MEWRCGFAALLVVTATVVPGPAQPIDLQPTGDITFDEIPGTTITLDEFLVLPRVGEYGRMPLHRDAVEAQLVLGTWHSPTAGDEVVRDGKPTATWQSANTDAEGVLDTRSLRGGYALATVELDEAQVMLLDASGHAAVYINGVPRTGDPYRIGGTMIPVELQTGRNELLFHVASDRLSARLSEPLFTVHFDAADRTVPTLVAGENAAVWGAVQLINTLPEPLVGLRLVCQSNDGALLATPLPAVGPLSISKVAFQFPTTDGQPGDRVRYTLSLIQGGDATNGELPKTSDEGFVASTDLELPVVGAHDIHIRTFRSTIDGSVQQYAVRPASHDAASDHEHHSPALMLALHPAGVSCEEFVEQYAAKDWAHVVVPTGRRAYGFDWEDWGRTDALEALADAQRHYSHNPARIFLTGNSMGGHGVWHLGVTYPARFAAIGPVDAWASFWSYGGGIPIADDDAPIDQMLLRAYAPSDTLKLIGNLRDVGVSIVHHENNTDVSVAQSRFMRSRLAEFHSRFAYFETPGSSETTTVDSPALMEFLRLQPTHTDDERDTIDFTTASPGVSHGSHWVSIEAQLEQLRPSRVAIRRDKPGRAFVAKTINVARLAIDIAQLSPSQPIHVAIDGQTLPPIDWPNSDARLWFERTDDEWTVSDPPDATQKHPHRYGTFKSVFDNRVVLVYGTQGTAEENAWAAAKARFDAETFWYRGNGSLDVLADTEFRPEAEPDRNVVLYGNADTNSAWPALLSTSPVQVRGGQVRVGVRPEADDDLATLFVRPRPGSDRAVVGVVGGTGPVGMRLTNRLRYFVSGVAYSDVLVFGPGVLTEGTADIRAAGFFGNDWRVESGEFEWRDMAL